MTRTRAERLALNEATFRLANERMAAWEERHREELPEAYYCECADIRCRKPLRLRPDEYEGVRRDSRQFLVAVGHADPTVERVVHHTSRYDVVQKNEDVRPLVEASDVRRGSRRP